MPGRRANTKQTQRLFWKLFFHIVSFGLSEFLFFSLLVFCLCIISGFVFLWVLCLCVCLYFLCSLLLSFFVVCSFFNSCLSVFFICLSVFLRERGRRHGVGRMGRWEGDEEMKEGEM